MKKIKIILLFFTLIVCFPCFSQEVQDTVYLKNGQIITGKIIGSYPDKSLKIKSTGGETYFFRSSDIFSGADEVQSVNAVPVAANSAAEKFYQEKYEHLQDSLQQARQAKQIKASQLETKPVVPLMSKEEFYKIRDRNMLKLMQEYDQTACSNFRSGMRMGKTGRFFTNTGVIVSSIGLWLTVASIMSKDEQMFISSLKFAAIGEVLIIIGLPFNIVSGARRNHTKDVFYDKYLSGKRQKSAFDTPTLQLKLVPNGVGLALNF